MKQKSVRKRTKKLRKIIGRENKREVPNDVHSDLILNSEDDKKSGIYFGFPYNYYNYQTGDYVGMPENNDGNIVVIGGNGSGKSRSIAQPTLMTWRNAIFALDIKGELSEFYKIRYQTGYVTRRYIVVDPTQPDSPAYDPFKWLMEDSEDNLIGNIQEIVLAILPSPPNNPNPFWIESERALLTAALLYYFKRGNSFSEAICLIMKHTSRELCDDLINSDDIRIKMILGEIRELSDKELATIDRELRNKLTLFATDTRISHFFRGKRENAVCFSWNDLNEDNIFLRIPANMIEQWSAPIRLMLTQLIRYLERRPEKYSQYGYQNADTLLLLDEFARFGKLEMITAAMATLRSKSVHICLIIQSIAQLDQIYGTYDRRIILDNCQYKAILNAGDAETQKYLSDLIGTRPSFQYSVSERLDDLTNDADYTIQISQSREPVVYPYQLAVLKPVLLLTPYGFCWVDKYHPANRALKGTRFIRAEEDRVRLSRDTSAAIKNNDNAKANRGAKFMSIKERTENARNRVDELQRKQRVEKKQMLEEQKKKECQRKFIIGELVMKYFPEIRDFESKDAKENEESLKVFIMKLSKEHRWWEQLEKRKRVSSSGKSKGDDSPSIAP